MSSNYIVSAEQLPEQLRKCGNPKVKFTWSSGKSFIQQHCRPADCPRCRCCLISERIDSIDTLISVGTKTINLFTIAVGGLNKIPQIPLFEKAWQTLAYKKELSKRFTFFASYELQSGLVNIHYAMFTDEITRLWLESFIMEQAANYFGETIGPNQTDIRPFDTALNLLDYVSKRHWVAVGDFAIPKHLKKIQCRWRKRYRDYFRCDNCKKQLYSQALLRQ